MIKQNNPKYLDVIKGGNQRVHERIKKNEMEQYLKPKEWTF